MFTGSCRITTMSVSFMEVIKSVLPFQRLLSPSCMPAVSVKLLMFNRRRKKGPKLHIYMII